MNPYLKYVKCIEEGNKKEKSELINDLAYLVLTVSRHCSDKTKENLDTAFFSLLDFENELKKEDQNESINTTT